MDFAATLSSSAVGLIDLGALVLVLIILIVVAWLVARAAERKHRSFWSFFWISFLVSPIVAAVVVAALPLTGDMEIAKGWRRPCSQCGEAIHPQARICPFCRV